MAKISRKTQKIFGSNAGALELGVFGSLAAGSVAYSNDPATIQSLSKYLSGWASAVLGANSPALEDLNSLCYLFAYQLAYIMQAGIAEWDSGTTYYIGSLVNSGGLIYSSLTNDNLNNAVTSSSNWVLLNSPQKINSFTTTATLTVADNTIVLADATTSGFTINLPAAASSNGKIFKIKKIDTTTNIVTIDANGSELIDTSLTRQIDVPMQSLDLVCNGTGWYIV